MANPRRRSAERERLAQAAAGTHPWKRWGPYLSERQWGTVREDYSAGGDAWSFFPHEHARSRAYRWGEDGLLGICDDEAFLCFALALWNGQDPILKERLFGLANPEGNHGEDVKELYYYLDATPTASYLKALYKYPQAAFPYERLRAENGRRSKQERELELLDTGVLDGDRYFDVVVEYAKAAPEDLCVRVTAHNRGPAPAPLHLVPTLWFRNTWSWGGGLDAELPKPSIRLAQRAVLAEHARLGRLALVAAPADGVEPRWLFTENETNNAKLFGSPNASPFVKDAFHEAIVHGRSEAVHPEGGTKAGAHYTVEIPARGAVELRLRLAPEGALPDAPLGESFQATFEARRREADELYEGAARPQDAATLRQACAGLVWSKQLYDYSVAEWLDGDPVFPPPAERRRGRNADWRHVHCRDVISMPDKWEFPWFAAWDLAFHTIPFAELDPDFAREQLLLMLREWYMHPSGQLAAYEYNFGDVNPPVHAWACRHLFTLGVRRGVEPDLDFLRRVFPKLVMNFVWWVNRKDPAGKGLFSGGFLGLDNIGVFDRSSPLPSGVTLEQADGTAWMALFSAEMLDLSLTLARTDPDYADMATTFLQHFAAMAEAINGAGAGGLWSEEDGFYYDTLRAGDRLLPMRVRSLVGLLPLIGVAVHDVDPEHAVPGLRARAEELVRRNPALAKGILTRDLPKKGARRMLLSLVPRDRLERVLRVMLDESEFLSPFGVRSLSRVHLDRPYVVELAGQRHEVRYLPGESDSWMFGGNSNWRGPVWFPVNAMLIEALATHHRFYGDELQVELPTGSGRRLNLRQVALELGDRLLSIFRPDARGRRPCHGDEARYADDPHFRDLLLFNEYFDGDTGRGCGASHQTGWTGLAATLARLAAEEEAAGRG